MDVPDYYNVSVRLMKVLDTVGLDDNTRWKLINLWIQIEQLHTISACEYNAKVHIGGSQAEATTILSLKSDIDYIFSQLISNDTTSKVPMCNPRREATTILSLKSDIEYMFSKGITGTQYRHPWEHGTLRANKISNATTPREYDRFQPVYNGSPVPMCNPQREATRTIIFDNATTPTGYVKPQPVYNGSLVPMCNPQREATMYIFGNATTPRDTLTLVGLQSDIVMLYCDQRRVLEDLPSWYSGSHTMDVPTKFLMVTDLTTPPGYVKLQNVFSDIQYPIGNLQTDAIMLDRYGRSCLYNNSRYLKPDTFPEHHGPANTNTEIFSASDPFKSVDYVVAVRNVSWPSTASEWITRRRENNWPTQETVSTIVQSGTLLVPVGHTLSSERHLEWRISISYGEKILVWQFNSTQYKCYVLLKMINKHYIKPMIGENVLTSYHWKTCMFYMIEATPTVLWQPQNLLHCIELCLMKMCTWVEECNCPNYFIPAENMFLDKVYGPVQRHLANILHYLSRQKGRYLTMIPYDGIGQKLIIACLSPISQIHDEKKDVPNSMLLVVSMILSVIWETWCDLLRHGVFKNPRFLENPSSSHVIRQEIDAILLRMYCSIIGSHLASQCLKQQAIKQEGLDTAYKFLLLGSSSDVTSGKLKLATFHLLQNNVLLAEKVLKNIEENYTFLVSNVQTDFPKDRTMLRIVNDNLSTTDVVRYYVAFPVPFLPSEMYCTPRALIPEMFRSTGSYQGLLDPKFDYRQSWAVVDPKLYLHFLLHQCYYQQRNINHKLAALGNMIWVIRHERLKFKDSAYNLLAYCLKQDGFLVQSYAVLSKSMKPKNHHNAAKWQIACLINSAFKWPGINVK